MYNFFSFVLSFTLNINRTSVRSCFETLFHVYSSTFCRLLRFECNKIETKEYSLFKLNFFFSYNNLLCLRSFDFLRLFLHKVFFLKNVWDAIFFFFSNKIQLKSFLSPFFWNDMYLYLKIFPMTVENLNILPQKMLFVEKCESSFYQTLNLDSLLCQENSENLHFATREKLIFTLKNWQYFSRYYHQFLWYMTELLCLIFHILNYLRRIIKLKYSVT